MYTCDWFSPQIRHIQKTLQHVSGKVSNILEIGSFEGRSAVWFLSTFPEARMVCVDTFQGSPEHIAANMDVESLFDRFTENTRPYADRLDVRRGHSSRILYSLDPESFDVIYVDGSHTEADTLMDLVLSFGLLKRGGALLVDDYDQPAFPGVKSAVDILVRVFDVTVVHNAYQVHVIKN